MCAVDCVGHAYTHCVLTHVLHSRPGHPGELRLYIACLMWNPPNFAYITVTWRLCHCLLLLEDSVRNIPTTLWHRGSERVTCSSGKVYVYVTYRRVVYTTLYT